MSRKDTEKDGASKPSDAFIASKEISLGSEDLLPDDGESNYEIPSRPSIRSDTNSYSSSQSFSNRSPLANRDPFGLTVLYTPESGYKLDIIFVHGLGGTSRMTWSRGRNLNYFWPQVFLPKEPEICDNARISTFGYNSSVFKGSGRTTISILDFAKGLLFDLKYASDDVGKNLDVGAKPIIFVVHSMGGLIVKAVSKVQNQEGFLLIYWRHTCKDFTTHSTSLLYPQ